MRVADEADHITRTTNPQANHLQIQSKDIKKEREKERERELRERQRGREAKLALQSVEDL